MVAKNMQQKYPVYSFTLDKELMDRFRVIVQEMKKANRRINYSGVIEEIVEKFVEANESGKEEAN